MNGMTQADYDSILTAVDSNVINRSEFYAMGQTMHDLDVPMLARNYSVSSDPSVLGSLILILVTAVVMMSLVRKVFSQQLKDFFSTERRFSTQETHYKDLWVFCAVMFIVFSAYTLALTHFDQQAVRYQFSPVLGIPYWLLGAGFAVYAVFCFAKLGIYALVNWVFFDSESNRNWLVSYLLLTSLAALAILSFSVMTIFTNIPTHVATWCYLFVAVLYELLLIYRLFVNFKIKKYGILLIFLYFCALEVMPALVLWHILDQAGDTFIEANVLY